MTIPISNIVSVNPSVLSGAGTGLTLNGLLLTADSSIPYGTVQAFSSASAVSTWFGSSTNEAKMAATYFAGFDNSKNLPANLYFCQYNAASAPSFLRSAQNIPLATFKLVNASLTLTSGANTATASINITSATSLSNVAAIIQAAFISSPFIITYDSLRNALNITCANGGSFSYATGAAAAGLFLTQATGAVISPLASASSPTFVMDMIIAQNTNWALFSTTFEPNTSDKLLFSAWVSGKKGRYGYVPWDTSNTALSNPDTTSFVYQANQASSSYVVPVYNDPLHAAFILGVAASIDFTRANGRTNFAFRMQSGLNPSANDLTTSSALETNGYNFIGSYGDSGNAFKFLFPGSVLGAYKFIDTFINQIYLNSSLQAGLMNLLTQSESVPYNAEGRALITAGCMDSINQALSFGIIRTGVTLSALQAAIVNDQAGVDISSTLSTRGWYLQVLDATAAVRTARTSPPINFWYMDGGSVQRINLASIVAI
jgi:hypothetical protein